MNKEKLYNAARSEAFDLVDCAHKTDSHDLVEAFVQGAEWLMGQPLRERLTEEEKEKLQRLYDESAFLADAESINKEGMAGAIYYGRIMALWMVFGNEMFEPQNNKI